MMGEARAVGVEVDRLDLLEQAKPASAFAELVWNALGADATEVGVSFERSGVMRQPRAAGPRIVRTGDAHGAYVARIGTLSLSVTLIAAGGCRHEADRQDAGRARSPIV
jgi:hypothetical protein